MRDDNKAAIVSMVAETHVHSGIGQSSGALDLPVARERTTHYPFVPGSGVKGALRVWARERAGLGKDIEALFGPDGQDKDDRGGDLFAGSLLCSDVRLLLLPVRCLSDAYKWVTCPALLSRFKRDCARAGVTSGGLSISNVNARQYLGQGQKAQWLGLEEREFECAGDASGLHSLVQKVVGDELKDFVDNRLVIVSDTDFTWFARYALPVMTRNALDKNKIVRGRALWHEETLAPDTVMYVLLAERMKGNSPSGTVAKVTNVIEDRNRTAASYIQIGGNETVGQGWFKMTMFEGAS